MSLDILVDPAQRRREEAAAQAERDTQKDTLEKELNDVQSRIPEKYRGKSVEELAKIAEDIEREKSRLGNELGQTRKQLLERQIEAKPKEPPKQVTADEVLTNPNDAIEQVVSQSPTINKVKESVSRLDELERNFQLQSFERTYPNYMQDLKDPAFIEWVSKSQVRQQLAGRADQYDFNAADQLWSLWDEQKDLVKQLEVAKEQAKVQTREKKLKDGMVESGTGGTTETKKVFSRYEIQNLKTRAKQGDKAAEAVVSDPNWQREVNAAYADGRVK